MREAIVNLVYPVLMQGLRLRERIDSGVQPDIEQEQSTLKGMLGIGSQVQWAAAAGGVAVRAPVRKFHPGPRQRSMVPIPLLDLATNHIVLFIHIRWRTDEHTKQENLLRHGPTRL